MPDLSFLAGDAAAARALADLAAQRWRKARDAAKDLCKKDRARYLPLLIAANAGLAQELLQRGLTQDAGPVIAHLKTIAPAEFVAALEAKQSGSAAAVVLQHGGPEQASAAGWRLLCAGAMTLEQGGAASAAALQAADQFVCGVLTPPRAATGADSLLTKELALVQAAVEATGDGRWEAAQETLRGLPRRSLFQHWRLFLRGVRCAHQGEAVAARQCFEALPAGSATARAAAPWRSLCGLPAAADTAPRAAAAALLTALCGAPSEWAAPVAAADAHWRGLRPGPAFDALRKGLRDQFPDDRPGLPGLLTDLVLSGKLNSTGLRDEAISAYFDQLYLLVLHKQCGSEREQKIIRRTLCLNDGHSMQPGAIEQHFAEIIRIDRKLHGADPLRESAAWTLAAELAMGGLAVQGLSVRDCTPRECGIIRMMHRQAAALDSASPAPALALIGFYEAAGETAAANSEITALTKKFPDNKELLLKSAAAAASRKAFAGALTSLRRARAIDPLDRDLSRRLVATLFDSAVETAKKKAVPATLWDELEPLLLDGPARPKSLEQDADFIVFRWVVQAGRALLEKNPAATIAAPSPVVGHFAGLLFAVRWRRAPDVTRLTALTTSAAPSLTWVDFEWIIRAAAWNQACKRGSAPVVIQLRAALEALGKPLLQRGQITADPQGALDCALAMDACMTRENSDRFYSLAWSLARNMSQAFDKAGNRKGADYRLRLASIVLPLQAAPFSQSCFCPVLKELEKTARAAGDIANAGVAQRLIGQCGARSGGFDIRNLFGPGDAGGYEIDDTPEPGRRGAGKAKGRRDEFRQPDLFSELFG